jgi:hypothetical protein
MEECHPIDRVRLARFRAPLSADRRGAFALEFAMVGPIFLLALLFVFNVAYDLFTNEVLNNAVQATARQMQTGTAPVATSQSQFVSTVVCPNTYGLIDCNNIFVRVEQIDTNTCSDFYNATTGTLPIASGTLQLGDYGGAGSDIGPSQCATSNAATGFCNAGPNEAILISMIYTAPSFIGRLLGTVVTYNGASVMPMLATAGFETEGFAPAGSSNPC